MTTAAQTVQQGDIGARFLVTITDTAGTVVDISGATTKEITIRPSGGASVTRTADFLTDGTDGKLFILSQSGDLDSAGFYEIQAKVIISGATNRSRLGKFWVEEKLD